MEKISQRYVDSLTSPGYFRDSELCGFYVRVYAGKKGISKIYMVIARPKGSTQNVSVTIGRHPIMTPDQARIKAKDILAKMASGEHPNLVKRKRGKQLLQEMQEAKTEDALARTTLRDLLSNYISVRKLRPNTERSYTYALLRDTREWLNLPITAITRDMIQTKHLQISKRSPAQANCAMRVLRALFTFAIAMYETPDGKPLLLHNPVDRLKHARLWNRIKRRQTVIRTHQLRAWYQALQDVPVPDARDILLVEIFTGLRHGEAVSIRWENVDFKDGTFTITDTKNHHDHMLPLTTQLESILRARYDARQSDEWVFPSDRSGHHMTDIRESVAFVANTSGVKFTEHDLRRTFETTAESLDISYYSLKELLNHKTGGDPTAGYIIIAAERLRGAAQKVASFLAHHMQMPDPDTNNNIAPRSNVIELKRNRTSHNA